MTYVFIDSFCPEQGVVGGLSWQSSLGDILSNASGADDPCLIDVPVYLFVNLLTFVLVALRFRLLNDPNRFGYAYDDLSFQTGNLTFAVLLTLSYAFQLNAIFFKDDQASISTASMHIGQLAVSTVLWICLSLVFYLEYLRYVLVGKWLLKLVTLLQVTVYGFKLYIGVDHKEDDIDDGSFVIMFYAQSALVIVIALCSWLHWPTSEGSSARRILLDGTEDEFQNYIPLVGRQESPEGTANCWETLTFGWMTPLLRLGNKRALEMDDMYSVNRRDQAAVLDEQFTILWNQELANKPEGKASLLRVWNKQFGYEFWMGGLIKLIFNDLSQFIGPIFLGLLIDFVGSDEPSWKGWLYAVSLFVGQILGAFGECQYFQKCQRVGVQVRSVMVSAIFRKAMFLDSSERATHDSGKINNLMVSDCEALYLVSQNFHVVWSSPLRIVISLFLLYQQLQWSALVGALLLVVVIPAQKKIIDKSVSYTKKALAIMDKRVKLTSEVMAAINVVKCYAWEQSFENRIDETRNAEIVWIAKAQYIGAFNFFLIFSLPVAVSLFTFALFVWAGNDLTPAKAFTSISLYSVLRMPLVLLPQTIASLAQTAVSIKRIQVFLGAKELEPAPIIPSVTGRSDISIKDANFSWLDTRDKKPALGAAAAPRGPSAAAPPARKEKSLNTKELASVETPIRRSSTDADAQQPFRINDVNIEVKQGELVAVVGSTGCGKSSLISAIMGDMNKTAGEVTLKGKIAYVPQQSWIFNATIRNNITFGASFDETRYKKAVDVAGMTRDMTLFPSRDLTEIGERGVNLSGGQKQRVALARAAYSGADVYLFDDPLSALDAHVGHEVFEKLIMKHLKDKTRILVTNQLQFVPQCDKVIMIQDGAIQAFGTYDEVKAKSPELAQMMKGIENSQEGASELGGKPDPEAKPEAGKAKSAEQGKLVVEEERVRGTIEWVTIKRYLEATTSLPAVMWAVISYVLTEVARTGSSFWLTVWTEDSIHKQVGFYLGVYAAISVSQGLFTLISRLLVAYCGVQAGRTLHNKMLSALLLAPMSFFHTTPLGRITNRFTKDVGDIDKQLAGMVAIFGTGILQLIGSMVVIGVATPFTIIAFIPIMYVFYYYQRYFQATSRELKRLDSITRSPIFNHFAQCLDGITSIRAYRAFERLEIESYNKLDFNVSIMIINFSSNRWLSLRLEFMGGILVFLSAAFAVTGRNSTSGAVAGLAISYALQVTQLLMMAVRLGAVAENSFNAVERVLYFADTQPEAPRFLKYNMTEKDEAWPSKGAVQFNDVKMRYRPDLPEVIKGLTFDVKPAEMIGIVGRTGAGKSSIFLTIYRIVELSAGKIFIDGVDISTLGMHVLRSRLSIIPQDPVLFTGTVRSNLDPFNAHSDDEIWDALDRSHLKKFVASKKAKLEYEVQERGSNFSMGQRQLLCMARALLRRSRILVLDEATASVDVETDKLIQETIRTQFDWCTIITIAHRLNTVIDSDRVMVLDDGKIAEFDSPSNLLANPTSAFSKMVESTGPDVARLLREAANTHNAKPRRRGSSSISAAVAEH